MIIIIHYREKGCIETLPKAQRTRGLSSSFQSNLLGYSQVQTQILIKLHLQNLDPAFTSKSQLNITSSTKLGIQNTKPSFSISTKIQLHNLISSKILTKRQPKNLAWTSTSKPWPNLVLKVWTKVWLYYQASAPKYATNCCQHDPQHQHEQQ